MKPRYAVNTAEIAADVLDGEAVLINLSNGMYYSLVGSGSFVWSCLERGLGGDEIIALLAAHYDVAPAVAGDDVRALMNDLLSEGLIVEAPEVSFGNPPQNPLAPPVQRAPSLQRESYETPQLKIYSDMQALLALDPPMPDLTDAPWKETDKA